MKNPKYLLWVGVVLVISAMAFVNAREEQRMTEIEENGGRIVTLEPSADLPPSILEQFTILVTQEGSGDAVAKAGDTVRVHYTGTLVNGTKFDSSLDRGTPFAFRLGAGMVIRGWDLGIEGMKVGEKRRLTIPPELGYGSRGAGDVIPPDATLVFETELVSID